MIERRANISEKLTEDQSQWSVLAGTRFFLSLVVVIGHLNYLPGSHNWTLLGIYLNQGSAVYGFLLISGYSIAASLERSPKGFIIRRVKRIWPSYIFSILLGVLVAISVNREIFIADQVSFHPLVWTELLASLTMTQTFIAPALSADGQIWTLAVEWWDYMAAPLLRRWSTKLLTAILFISMVAFILSPPPSNPANDLGGKMFFILGWWWLAGFLYHRHRGTVVGYVLLFAPPLIVAVDGWIGRAAVVGLIALASSRLLPVSKRIGAILNWLGDLSYPLYLVHVPILFALFLLHVYEPALIAAASLLVAAFVLHFVDAPFRSARLAGLAPRVASG